MSYATELLAKISKTDDAITAYNLLFQNQNQPTPTEVVAADAAISDAVKAEISASMLAHFEEQATIENVLRHMLVDVVRIKRNKNEAGVVTSMERATRSIPVDPVKLMEYFGNVAWAADVGRLHAALTIRAMREVGADDKDLQALRSIPYVREMELREKLGETPMTNSQGAKMLQTALDGLCPGLKARGLDIKWMMMVFTKKDRKNRIQPLKLPEVCGLVCHVAHCLLTGERYEFNLRNLAQDKMTVGSHFQMVAYVTGLEEE